MEVKQQIMEVLNNRSCMERPLNLKQIGIWVDRDFGVSYHRDTISKHVHGLLDDGYVCYQKGYYPNFLLDRLEERVLIDSLLYSKQLPAEKVREIIRKLLPETSPRRECYALNVEYLVDLNRTDNDTLYKVLDMIDLAIRRNRRILVTPCKYDIEAGFEDGTDYLFDPYYIISDKCRYYVLGGCEKHGIQMEPRRIDRISDVKMTRTARMPIDYYWNEPVPFDIKTYLMEHVYMFPGKSSTIKMEIVQSRIGDFIDWFGKKYTVLRKSRERNGKALISVYTNENAALYWAMQYSSIATILSPDSLMKRIFSVFKDGYERYARLLNLAAS